MGIGNGVYMSRKSWLQQGFKSQLLEFGVTGAMGDLVVFAGNLENDIYIPVYYYIYPLTTMMIHDIYLAHTDICITIFP